MSDFSVYPSELRACATRLREYAQSTQAALDYAGEYGILPADSGGYIGAEIPPVAKELYTNVQTHLNAVKAFLLGSSDELDASAYYYETTEDEAAKAAETTFESSP